MTSSVSTPDIPPAGSTGNSRSWFGNLVRSQEFGVFLILVALMLFLSLYTRVKYGEDRFITSTNIFNNLRSFSWIAISAFGQCMVIITTGIDLSVGSVMAWAGLVTAMALVAGVPVFLAVPAGLIAGSAVGVLNGLMITKGKLPPFIATLGTLLMARGVVNGIAQGQPVRGLPQSFISLGRFDLPVGPWGIPLPLIIMLILAVLCHLFLTRTVWGYRIYAIGGNETAAGLSGINTGRVKIMVYTLCALLTSIGGILMTARLGVAAPTAANGYELDVIAATVVGGTSLSGGEGSILGVLIGAAIMQVLRSGLVMVGIPAYWLQAVQGLVIVVAIMFDMWRKSRR
jgi:ribose transport system permease protein